MDVGWERRPPLCHPERTRISCHAAPDTVACAPFSKERRMKFANAIRFYRKSGEAEGSAVQRTFRGNVFDRGYLLFSFSGSHPSCRFGLSTQAVLLMVVRI